AVPDCCASTAGNRRSFAVPASSVDYSGHFSATRAGEGLRIIRNCDWDVFVLGQCSGWSPGQRQLTPFELETHLSHQPAPWTGYGACRHEVREGVSLPEGAPARPWR